MLLYMGTVLEKVGNYMVMKDDTPEWMGKVIVKMPWWKFLKDSRINEFSIARDWRRAHPAKGY